MVIVGLVQFEFQVLRCSRINIISLAFYSYSFLYRRRCKPPKIRTEWQIDETRDFFVHVCKYIRLVCYSRRSDGCLLMLGIRRIIIKYYILVQRCPNFPDI
jgi:hypothetical protein